MKKLLLIACLSMTTSAFALPNFGKIYNGEPALFYFNKNGTVMGQVGAHMCAFDAKFKVVNNKTFNISPRIKKAFEGDGCDEVKSLKGEILETQNNKVTKFKIAGQNMWSGVFELNTLN